MAFNWKHGVTVGVVVFLYLFARNKFWPDVNIFLDFLILTLLIGVTVKISEAIFLSEK